jgi:23S rRNA U2552 (ribose-2'-O)-methylase RlmE/FtsJ
MTSSIQLQDIAKLYPIGKKVKYYPIKGRSQFELTEIKSRPWMLGNNQVVVKVGIRPGGVSIDHIKPA